MNGATVTWTTDAAATSEVDYGTTPAFEQSPVKNASQATSHRILLSGLVANQKYYFRISSCDASNHCSVSNASTFTTAANLSGTGSVTLAWDGPATNTDGSPVADLAGYRVYMSATSGRYGSTPVSETSATITQITIPNLAKGTFYFKVSAIDTSSNESQLSSEISKTIQ